MYSNQIKFLDKEKLKILKDFEILANSKALALFEKEELFLGQFIKVDQNGMMQIAFPTHSGIPMRGIFLWAFILKQEDCNYKAWGDTTYMELHAKALEYSNVQCVWKQQGKFPNSILAGFTGLQTQMAAKIKPGSLVVFGSPEPPVLYYENLKAFIEKHGINYSQILDQGLQQNNWEPSIIENTNNTIAFILGQLKLVDVALIQGPPGTGKTTLIARIIKQLLKEGKSVLVSALANKALMELASHEELSNLIAEGKILKTNLSEDEKKELPNLLNIKDLGVLKGKAVLSTFYKSSSLFDQFITAKFDFVIVDEASQAFLGTLAGFKHIGNKNIWVGDQNQLPPVVRLNQSLITKLDVENFIHGFQTVCQNNLYPGFMMNKSFRFGKRAASLTGIFYDNNLESVSRKSKISINGFEDFFHSEEGSNLIKLDLELGSKTPKNVIPILQKLVKGILSKYPYEILIIAPFKKTVNWIEKIFSDVASRKLSVSTIDKIQGKNTDICIFLVPNTRGLYSFQLNMNRFNVATSRAKYHTLIIADNRIVEFVPDALVRTFLKNLKNNQLEGVVKY